MLVLSRKKAEQIQIGDHVILTVVGIRGGRVKLGIEAPGDVLIRRPELPPLATGVRTESAKQIHNLPR